VYLKIDHPNAGARCIRNNAEHFIITSHAMLNLEAHSNARKNNAPRASPTQARECRQHNYDPSRRLSLPESARHERSASPSMRTRRNSSTLETRGLAVDRKTGATTPPTQARECRQHNYDPSRRLSLPESTRHERSASPSMRARRSSSTLESRGLAVDRKTGATTAVARRESLFSRAQSPMPTWQPTHPVLLSHLLADHHLASTSLPATCVTTISHRESCKTASWPNEVKAFQIKPPSTSPGPRPRRSSPYTAFTTLLATEVALGA